MKKPGCSKCEETTVQGRAYIDEKPAFYVFP